MSDETNESVANRPSGEADSSEVTESVIDAVIDALTHKEHGTEESTHEEKKEEKSNQEEEEEEDHTLDDALLSFLNTAVTTRKRKTEEEVDFGEEEINVERASAGNSAIQSHDIRLEEPIQDVDQGKEAWWGRVKIFRQQSLINDGFVPLNEAESGEEKKESMLKQTLNEARGGVDAFSEPLKCAQGDEKSVSFAPSPDVGRHENVRESSIVPDPQTKEIVFATAAESDTVYNEAIQCLMLDSENGAVGKQQPQIELLARAFQKTAAQQSTALSRFNSASAIREATRKLLHKRLDYMDRHQYYALQAFETEQEYSNFVRTQTATINRDLTSVTQQIEQAARALKQRHVVPEEKEQKQDNVKRPPPKRTFCFCFSVDSEPEAEPLQPPPLPVEKEVAVAAAVLIDEPVQNQQPLLDYHSGCDLLLLVLMQAENPDLPLLTADPPKAITDRLNLLSDDGEWILSRWCHHYGVTQHYYYLLYLELLLRKFRVFPDYFEKVTSLLNFISSEADTTAWTKHEKKLYLKLISSLYEWCVQCVLRYQKVFYENYPPNGLTHCLELLQQTHSLLVQKRPDFIDQPHHNFVKLCQHLVTTAIDHRYQRLLRITSAALDASGSGPLAQQVGKMAEEDDTDESGKKVNENLVAQQFGVDFKIRTVEQMLCILEEIMIEIQSDKAYFDSQFHVVLSADFDLESTSAQAYFTRVWSDAQLFLRFESLRDLENAEGDELSDAEKPLDPLIWQLYQKMGEFVKWLAQFVQLPELQLQSWFSPFVSRWIARKEEEFNKQYLGRILQLESWKMLSEQDGTTKHSQSVIDVFTFLYSLTSSFKQFPHSRDQATRLIKLLCGFVESYVRRVGALVQEDIGKLTPASSKVPFAVTQVNGQYQKDVVTLLQLSCRLNNIRIMRKRFQELLEEEEIGKVYSEAPKLSQQQQDRGDDSVLQSRHSMRSQDDDDNSFVQLNQTNIDGLDGLDAFDDSLLEEMDDSLARYCRRLFQFIKDTLRNATRTLTSLMSPWLVNQCKAMVNAKPKDEEVKIDDGIIHDRLEHVFKYILLFRDNLKPVLYRDLFLALSRSVLEAISVEFEKMVLPDYKNADKTLTSSQYDRSKFLAQLLREYFLEELTLSVEDINICSSFTRFQSLVVFFSQPSAELVKEYDLLPESDSVEHDLPEETRIRYPPYCGRRHIFTMFRFRKQANPKDSHAKKFLDKNQGSFDSFLDRFRI